MLYNFRLCIILLLGQYKPHLPPTLIGTAVHPLIHAVILLANHLVATQCRNKAGASVDVYINHQNGGESVISVTLTMVVVARQTPENTIQQVFLLKWTMSVCKMKQGL